MGANLLENSMGRNGANGHNLSVRFVGYQNAMG